MPTPPRRPGSLPSGSQTQRGYSVPHEVGPYDPTDAGIPLPPPGDGAGQAQPLVEVQVIEERGPMKKATRWRALELWTKNRVYSLDAAMTCIEVINRATGRPDDDHPLLGGRLTGGQRKDGQRMKLAHPFPVPGTDAVFKLPHGRSGRFGQTSKIERVVLRVRVADVPLLESEPMWEDLAGRWSVRPSAPPGEEPGSRR